MCGLRKRLKEESSASSRLCALWRIFPKLAGVTEAGILTTYVVICERGELCEQQASRAQSFGGYFQSSLESPRLVF
jgi:hypothetical protein